MKCDHVFCFVCAHFVQVLCTQHGAKYENPPLNFTSRETSAIR